MHRGSDTNLRRPFSTNSCNVQAGFVHPYSKDIDIVFGREFTKQQYPETPNDLCCVLQSKKRLLENVLGHHDIFKDKFVSIWSLIASCCQCEKEKELSDILKTVNDKEEFVITWLLKFLVKLKTENNPAYEVQSLQNITIFLERLVKLLPDLSVRSLTLILPFLKDAVKENVIHLGQELLHRVELLEARRTELEGKVEVKVNWSDIDEPETNFRNIKILPDMSEILSAESKRFPPQILQRQFDNVEHYLNWQFHLNRRALIRSVQQKFAIYSDYVKNGKEASLYEIGSHSEVLITNILVSEDGVLHEIEFPSSSFLKDIPWKYCKHFTAGSLLCFSSDNFKTVYFAAVVGHKTVLLEQRKFYVCFEPEAIMRVNSNDSTAYAVIEIDVHFDVLFRTLSNLQRMSSNNFPFEEYIIHSELRIEPPRYAKDKFLKYCFGPVFLKDTKPGSVNANEVSSSGDCNCAGERIQIHNDLDWKELDIGLDETQSNALRNALTQRLAIIQGSPGTGKTHVALKLAQILLHNRRAWSNENDSCPVVVLTHTNHSLDKFLEGMSATTGKILRIGGESESNSLVNYNLKRQSVIGNAHIRAKAKREIGTKLKEISQTITGIEKRKLKSKCELLKANELSESVAKDDLDRLKVNCDPSLPGSVELDTLLRIWLSIDKLQPDNYEMELESTNNENSSGIERNTGRDVEHAYIENLKYVQDASFIHKQRTIDGEFQELTALFIYETSKKNGKLSTNEKSSDSDRQNIVSICEKLNVVPMTAAQSAFCTDLWDLSLEERWGLYCFWLKKFNEKCERELQDCREEYREQLTKLKAVTENGINKALNDVDVLGLTVTGAAKYCDFLIKLKPKVIIVSEADKILDSQILFCLNEETEHLILIGDQLSSELAASLFEPEETSLFHRLWQSGFPFCRLGVKYNSLSCISDLLVSTNHIIDHPRGQDFENIKGMENNVFFLTHSNLESRTKDGTCCVNDFEMSFIVELSRYIVLQGYPSSSIAILTLNLAQFYTIRKRMNGNLEGVRVSVYDHFEEDSDIVLVSFVESGTNQDFASFKDDFLLYTALSRAKKGLYCVGHFEAFAKSSRIWKNLYENLKEKNCLGPQLNVLCQAHRNVASIKSPKDIMRLGDGGCGQSCKYRMACGHECPRKCHPNDREHKNSKCMATCQVPLCNQNHKCLKLCWEKCGKCQVILENVVLRCGHSTQAPCFRLSVEQNSCWQVPYKVDDSLYGKEDIKLNFAVKFNVDNKSDAICFPSLEQECKVPCGKQLECGHLCKGKCGECMGGRIHVPCVEVCGKMQLCGHKCIYPCNSPCPPCSFQYENSCSHKRWTVFCGFPTTPCLQPCSWSCEHLSCKRLCHEPCDRPPCFEPCRKKLKCGHPCIGMCGDLCPDKCRFCNYNEVSSIIFGHEQDPRARFMQLEDCGHIFEVSGFTAWISSKTNNNPVIGFVKCPICLKPILKNQRFSNFVKHQLEKIEELKRTKYQMMCNISEVKNLLSDLKNQLNVLSKRNMAHERFWAEEQPCTDPCSVLETLYARLFLKYNPIDQGALALFYNYYTFVVENYKIVSKMEKLQQLAGKPFLSSASRRTCDFVGHTLEGINERIVYFWEFGSPQFIQEIASELRRLHLACNFVTSYQSLFECDNGYIHEGLEKALNTVLQDFPFKNQQESMFNFLLQEIQKISPDISSLEIVAEPPCLIVEAMDIQEGQWYQCFAGHLCRSTRSNGNNWRSRLEDCQTCNDINNHLKEDGH